MRLYNMLRFLFIFAYLSTHVACGGSDEPSADVLLDSSSTDEGTELDEGSEDSGPVATDEGTEVVEDIQETDVPQTTCSSQCDCAQGFACIEGECTLGSEAVFCCANDDCPQDAACSNTDGSAGLCGVETASAFGKLVINEVLIDGTTDGDPNQDGEASDPIGDEFIEIVNKSSDTVDLSDFYLVEKNLQALPRHTFEFGRTLAPGKAIVVFGGGTAPEDTESSIFVVANAADPGIALGLHLNDDSDDIRILDKEGRLVVAFNYGPTLEVQAQSDQSITRNPDIEGDFVSHTEASGDEAQIFSPGTRIDGSSF